MLCVPVERVTVMLAFGRSRMTVSFCPEVGPLPAAPGSRGVGSGPRRHRRQLSRRGDRHDRRLAAVPVRQRAPVAAAVVPPDRGDQLVLQELEAAVGDVEVEVAVAVVEAVQPAGAGVLPEHPRVGHAVIVPRAVDRW